MFAPNPFKPGKHRFNLGQNLNRVDCNDSGKECAIIAPVKGKSTEHQSYIVLSSKL